jgi:hypothetical protein
MKTCLVAPNCGVKLRSKEESSLVLAERYEQLKLEGKEKSREARIILEILRRIEADGAS